MHAIICFPSVPIQYAHGVVTATDERAADKDTVL